MGMTDHLDAVSGRDSELYDSTFLRRVCEPESLRVSYNRPSFYGEFLRHSTIRQRVELTATPTNLYFLGNLLMWVCCAPDVDEASRGHGIRVETWRHCRMIHETEMCGVL